MINIVEKYNLKVGDKISLFPPDADFGEELIGIIGEMNERNFYVWNNEMDGYHGDLYPSDKYTYSWSVNVEQNDDYNLKLKVLNIKTKKIDIIKLNKTLCDSK